MLTRRATQKKFLEESSTEDSSTTDSSQGEFTAVFGTEDETSDNTSLTTLISYKERMEETAALQAAPIRKKVERLISKAHKQRDMLARRRDEPPQTWRL